METNFWALPGNEPGTLCTRVKDLNHCVIMLLCIYSIISRMLYEIAPTNHPHPPGNDINISPVTQVILNT